MPETPADELVTASDVLGQSPAPGTARIINSERLQPEIVAVCDRHNDPDNPPAYQDAHGCCGDCEFIVTYSPAVARQLAALINARPALVEWLDSWDGIEVREDGPMPDDYQHALAVARAMNGSARG